MKSKIENPKSKISVRLVHRHAWLWEPLEMDASFVLRAMFGTKAAYLDGRLHLCFCANEEPWRGVLVGTERIHHASLQAEFPSLVTHPILGKWLYLSEECDDFESAARRLVALARRRDPRIGIVSPTKKRSPARQKKIGRPT